MRLDRVNLRAVSDILRAMVKEAMMEPGKVVRMALPTSPADGVQGSCQELCVRVCVRGAYRS